MTESWLRRADDALEHKRVNFQKMADLGMKFFDGPYDFMYGSEFAKDASQPLTFLAGKSNQAVPMPAFRMSLNRVAEMVQLIAPFLYHKNPARQVNPRQFPEIPQEMLYLLAQQQAGMQQMGMGLQPPMMPPGMGGPGMGMPGLPPPPTMGGAPPMMPGMDMGMMAPDPAMLAMMAQDQQRTMQQAVDQTRANLMHAVLNYTPNELGLKDHSRRGIDEAIIKGKGVLWPEIFVTQGGRRLVGSFYDTVDNLIIDPDMELESEAKWIGRRCIHPVWDVERTYELPPGTIKANLESVGSQAGRPRSDQPLRDRRGTNDLVEYWKIYSRMGCGARIAGTKDAVADLMESFGDNVYIVVAKGVPWPLNLPMIADFDMEKAAAKLQWPIPFHVDPTSPWPYAPFEFHPRPRKVWPQSHLQPAMAELLFLNWAYSYLMTKIATTSRDLLAIASGLEAEARKALESGDNLAILNLAQGQGFNKIEDMIQFIQHPPMNKDIWDVIQAVEAQFERRTGLSELVYGDSQRGMRSAEEAALKGDQIKIRPDDMATRVEETMTLLARKEAIAWHMLSGKDVKPIVGPEGAQLWDTIIGPLDPEKALEFEYRIEAGSIRKPNRERDVANAAQAMQTVFQPLFEYAMTTGNVGPVNAVLTQWAKSLDMDPKPLILSPPPAPPPIMPGEAQPPPA